MQLKVNQKNGVASLPRSTTRIQIVAIELLKQGEMLCAVQMKRCIPLMLANMLAVADWGSPRRSVAIRPRKETILLKQAFAILSNMMALLWL